MVTEVLARLNRRLDETSADLRALDAHYEGRAPMAFLAPQAREALGNRLKALYANYPRLVVSSLAERLRVEGFEINGAADLDLWRAWERCGLPEGSAQAHTDALVLGRSFVIVWADSLGRPVATPESAHAVAVERHPVSREVTAAVKRWTEPGTWKPDGSTSNGRAHAVLYLPGSVRRYVSASHVPEGGTVPPHDWNHVETLTNPLGVVPVVPLVNAGRMTELDGVSEMADVLDLSDALAKLLTDLLVSSEFYARPRRWATGLDVVEDEDGNPVSPFGTEANRVWQSEQPETKFGQFDAARLDGYGDAVNLLREQISAVSGLPAHYLGVHGDQPPSADAIRSAEASLVARAQARQRTFGRAWSQVAALMVAVRDGVDPRALQVETAWASAETRTPAQAADAAAKLVAANILPLEAAQAALGYGPEAREELRAMTRRAALDRAAVDLAGTIEVEP